VLHRLTLGRVEGGEEVGHRVGENT
jgi:hypothetical protein